jgi:hypothetical protein
LIDTLAKRAASSRFALGGSAIRPPTGTFSQIERGYTLGLYTFTYVASDGPVRIVSFSSGEGLRGGLVGTVTSGGLVGSVTTGGLVAGMPEVTLPWLLSTGFWDDDAYWVDTATWDDGEQSLAANYIARVAAEGTTLGATGQSVISAVLQAVEDEGKTIGAGWLFGSEVNVDNENLQLNLVEGKGSIVPAATYHASTNLSEAMLGIRNNGDANHAAKTHDGSGLFDGTDNFNVLFFITYSGDDIGGGGSQTSPNIFTNGESGSFPGHIQMFGGATGGAQFIDRPTSVTGMGGASGGGSATLREENIDPIAMWAEYTPNEFRTIHPDGTTEAWKTRNGTTEERNGKPLYLCNSATAGDVGYCFILRIEGSLTSTQRDNIWQGVYAAWRKVGRSALIVGNSVTITGVSSPMSSWPKQMQRWGAHNNTVCVRRAQGGRRLPYFAPTGYTELDGAPTDSDIAVMPVNIFDWYAPNIICNDEQQNKAGFLSTYADRWPVFLHCHNAIVARFNAMQEAGRMRAVMCTQIAWPNYDVPGTLSGTPLTYAQVGARAFMRDMSIATRAEPQASYNSVPTSIADWYALTNVGWPVGDDGTSLDPINDLPKGNVDMFADPQHPNQTGHDAAFTMWRDALLAAYAL